MATSDELVARAAALHELIARNAEKGEELRRLPEETLRALEDAELFQLCRPRRYGGFEESFRTLLDVCSTVAEADGGAAWVLSLGNGASWVVGLFPREAQEELWGANERAWVCSSLPPTSTGRPVPGGYRVTGRWSWVSGCCHAPWAILGSSLTDESGAAVDHGVALIPLAELGFEDTWRMAGMRSTGSHSVIAEDVFVPAHRMISLRQAVTGELAGEEPRYRSGVGPTASLLQVAPQLGLGRAALRIVRAAADTKPVASTSYTRQTDSVGFQLQLAEAATRIDTAHLHSYRAAADVEAAAERGAQPDVLTRARIRADVSWAVEQIRQAIELLMSAHGAGGFAESAALQRIWRDAAVAARHPVALPAMGLETYGKALLGRGDHVSMAF